MNSIRKIIYVITVIFTSLSVTSCLDDEMINSQKYGLINLDANKILEIPSDASHEISLTLLPEGEKQITIGEVRLAAENPASEDIVVTLTKDTAGIFKAGEGIFPLDKVTVPATVTIPKGQRSTPLVITINTAYLESEPTYIAVSIKAADKAGYIISGNYGTVKINAKVKHKYQGRYVCTGSFSDVTNAAWSHASGELTIEGEELLYDLETVDGSTIAIGYSPTFDNRDSYFFYTGSGFSRFASFCPQFTFDNNGNITAVTNIYGQPASNTRSAELDPTGVNKYNPATKSFTVSYWMNQSSVVVAPPHHRTHIVETYTFKEDL